MTCPKCRGPTIQKALFSSFYDHCEPCENLSENLSEQSDTVGLGMAFGTPKFRFRVGDQVCDILTGRTGAIVASYQSFSPTTASYTNYYQLNGTDSLAYVEHHLVLAQNSILKGIP